MLFRPPHGRFSLLHGPRLHAFVREMAGDHLAGELLEGAHYRGPAQRVGGSQDDSPAPRAAPLAGVGALAQAGLERLFDHRRRDALSPILVGLQTPILGISMVA